MAQNDEGDLAAVLARVAQVLAAEKDLDAVGMAVCRLAVETIEGCEHADVMIVAPGGVLTVPGASDWVGVRVVSLESELDEGPCIEAFRTGTIIDSPDHTEEQRWPRFTPRLLAETPVRSGLGLPLRIKDEVIGALDLYAGRPHAFSDDDRGVAALYAAHSAIAFEAARDRVRLEQALANRDIIGQAKGILMARSQLGSDDAFELLRRASQRLNQKLVVVAQDIVERHDPT